MTYQFWSVQVFHEGENCCSFIVTVLDAVMVFTLVKNKDWKLLQYFFSKLYTVECIVSEKDSVYSMACFFKQNQLTIAVKGGSFPSDGLIDDASSFIQEKVFNGSPYVAL